MLKIIFALDLKLSMYRSSGISVSFHIKTNKCYFNKKNMIEEKDGDDFGKRKDWNNK